MLVKGGPVVAFIYCCMPQLTKKESVFSLVDHWVMGRGYWDKMGLTLKRLGHFFPYVILFPNVVQLICNIFIWNWSNKLNVESVLRILMAWCFIAPGHQQSGRSPKVVALFSATNFSSYIIELLQLHDTIQIIWNYAWIHYNITIRSHIMI